jgi:hypothetical protein
VAAGGKDGFVRVWNMKDGQLRWKLRGHTGEEGSLLMLPNARLLLSDCGTCRPDARSARSRPLALSIPCCPPARTVYCSTAEIRFLSMISKPA